MAYGIIILAAILLIVLLAAIARRPLPAEEPAQDAEHGEYDRIRRLALRSRMSGSVTLRAEKHMLRKLRRIIHDGSQLPAAALAAQRVRELALLCLDVREALKKPLRLPADQHGEARMMRLCMALLEEDDRVTLRRLLDGLQTWQEAAGTTLRERESLPLCMKLTLTQLLSRTLDDLRLDASDLRRGHAVAARLPRTRHREKLLRSVRHSPACVRALLKALQEQPQGDLIGSVEQLLSDGGVSPAQAEALFTRRQDVLAQRVQSIIDTWHEMDRGDWHAMSEPSDPLHALYMQDPSGVYARMDDASRRLYREETARLARRFHVEESRLAHACIHLAQRMPADSLRHHVGWYLLEHDGRRALRRHLCTRRGMLSELAEARTPWLYRVALSVASVAMGLSFLNRGHPLWMLPFFLGVAATLSHAAAGLILRRIRRPPQMPRLDIPAVTDDERTLIVLPAVLRDPAHAVQMVRQLLLARESCADGAIDCLLLADHPDNPTVASSMDNAVIAAADEAMRAISTPDRAFYYMQRQRAWDAETGAFNGRGGKLGALEALNRLICEGTCDDRFDHVTLDPQKLYRRYAFVLTLDGDARLAPDSLPAMIGALSHPLNQRQDTPRGPRGFGMLQPRRRADPARTRTWIALLEGLRSETPWPCLDGTGTFSGTALYRPDAMIASPEALLTGELSGCADFPAEELLDSPPATTTAWLRRTYRATVSTARLVPWLLPWVPRQGDVTRNPLPSHSRSRLRDALRRAALPMCRVALMLYGALARSETLVLLAALLPMLPELQHGWRGLLRAGAELCLLPYRCVVQTDALARTLWRMLTRKPRPRAIASDAPADAAEIFSQSIAALTLLGVSVVPMPPCVAGCVVAVLWGCFLPVLRRLDAPVRPVEPLTEESAASLMDAARATWRFFADTVNEQSRHLPPAFLQEEPPAGAARHATLTVISMYLLSCIAALELEILSADEAAARLSNTADTLEKLPCWRGLPYSAYDLATLDPLEPREILSTDCGYYCAALLTAAQAMRAHLPEIDPARRMLPARLDALATAVPLRILYNHDAQRFAVGIDFPQETRSAAHHDLLASPSLVCSMVAMMRREIPRRHFMRLSRAMTRMHRGRALLSPTGGMADYFAAALLLPMHPRTRLHDSLLAALRAQQKFAPLGVFGVSESACWSFDEQLHYRRQPFGLPGLSASNQDLQYVFSPYASALALPFAPQEAADNLSRMRALSMFGRCGFFESIDTSPARLPAGMDHAIVRSYFADHQGMILCAICNALTGALPRHFAMLPDADAWLLLLRESGTASPAIPADLLHTPAEATAAPPFSRAAEALAFPVDAHVLSGGGTTLAVTAQGMGFVAAQGVPVTRFTGDCTQAEGMQIFVIDGERVFQSTDPTLDGETRFEEGCAVFRRIREGIEATLRVIVDPLTGDVLHALTLDNHSSRERRLEAASLLIPAHPADCERKGQDTLRLALYSGQTILHSVTGDGQLLRVTALTDHLDFASSLRKPMQDRVTARADCASLRVCVQLEAHGRAQICFRTRLQATAQHPSDPQRALELARIHSRMLTDSLGLSQADCAVMSRMFGALLWRGQPHQGANQPLTAPLDSLRDVGVDPDQPLVLIYADSPRCADIVREVSRALGWLSRMGVRARLCVLAQGDDASAALHAAQAVVNASPMRHDAVLLRASALPDGVRETLGAAARLTLFEDADLATQLAALTVRVPVGRLSTPEPLPLPAEELIFDNGLGGFHPQSGDYVIRAGNGAQHALPRECLLLEDGNNRIPAMPMGDAGRFRIQLGTGVTEWRSAYDGLELSFTAADMADRAAQIRTLRVRKTAHRAKSLTLSYCMQFGDDTLTHLTLLTGGVTAQRPDSTGIDWLFIAEGEAAVRTLSAGALWGLWGEAPALASGEDGGNAAILRSELTLEAQQCASLTWVAGRSDTADDAERTLSHVRRRGASSVIRTIRQRWAQRLLLLTVATPEAPLNLLLNRILPYQARAGAGCGFLALLHTEPEAAQEALLAMPEDEFLPLFAAWYAQRTGDHDTLRQLHDRCMVQLTGVTLGANGLVLFDGEEVIWRNMLYAATLRAYASFVDAEQRADMLDMAERIRLAAERSAWQGAWYRRTPADDALDLRTQAWAALAGMPHGRDALTEAWRQLYDPAKGVMRLAPDDGQDTTAAAWMLLALTDAGLRLEAWTLLRALNPIHHALNRRAAETYRATPNALSSNVDAEGRGSGDFDAACAAWLYTAALERLLGFWREGDRIRFAPVVPDEWENYTITLTVGASTWRFELSRGVPVPALDGEPLPVGTVTLIDDGRIHHVRLPLPRT